MKKFIPSASARAAIAIAKEARRAWRNETARDHHIDKWLKLRDRIEVATPAELIAILTNGDSTDNCVVIFHDHAWGKKALKRWAGDFWVNITDGEIAENSLIQRTWNYDDVKAKSESDEAIRYFARQWFDSHNSLTYEVLKQ